MLDWNVSANYPESPALTRLLSPRGRTFTEAQASHVGKIVSIARGRCGLWMFGSMRRSLLELSGQLPTCLAWEWTENSVTNTRMVGLSIPPDETICSIVMRQDRSIQPGKTRAEQVAMLIVQYIPMTPTACVHRVRGHNNTFDERNQR